MSWDAGVGEELKMFVSKDNIGLYSRLFERHRFGLAFLTTFCF